ncbi:MAG: RIP metalloprotease RseP [Candidatus Omnitrophota bacterium]
MISLLIYLLILGLLIVVHEFGHFIVAKRVGVRVEKFSLGFGPKLLSKKKGDTEYTINAIPWGGYVKLAGDNQGEYKNKSDEYLAKSPAQRAAILFFGPLLNYVLGFLFFWLIFFIGYPAFTTKVGNLIDGYGAKNAGIQIGDKIIAVDGQRVDYWDELQKLIQAKKNSTAVKISLLRDDRELNFDVRIKQAKLEDIIGQKENVGLIGIKPAEDIINIRHGFWKSAVLGMDKTWGLTVITYKAFWRIITGRLSFRESVSGPLGIFYVTSQAVRIGIIAVLHLVAILSISLAIFNLLPLPVLDGGHILLLVIEKIRKRTLSVKAEQIVTQIGLTLIISLALFATYNDVAKLFGKRIVKFLNPASVEKLGPAAVPPIPK